MIQRLTTCGQTYEYILSHRYQITIPVPSYFSSPVPLIHYQECIALSYIERGIIKGFGFYSHQFSSIPVPVIPVFHFQFHPSHSYSPFPSSHLFHSLFCSQHHSRTFQFIPSPSIPSSIIGNFPGVVLFIIIKLTAIEYKYIFTSSINYENA